MAEIFISYANEDRDSASALANLLESAGWTVWWDRRIPAGRTWRSMIEEALKEMRCMVVIWSAHSVASDWVKEEAEEARALGKIVPVLIDDVKPPVGFRTIQAADLIGWDGDHGASGARQLLIDIEGLVGKPKALIAAGLGRTAENEQPPQRTANIGEGSDGGRDPKKHVQANAHDVGSDFWNLLNRGKYAVGAVAVILLVAVFAWRGSFQTQTETSEKPAKDERVLPPPEPTSPQLQTLTITAGRSDLQAGDTLELSAQGKLADGNTANIAGKIVWQSSDAKVATIDGQGRVKALQPGATNITGRVDDIVSDSLRLTVRPEIISTVVRSPKLERVTVSTSATELKINQRSTARLSGSYSDGSEKRLTAGVHWSSSDSSVATVSGAGEIVGRRVGNTRITARMDDLTSGPITIVVKDEPPKVKPDPPKIPAEPTPQQLVQKVAPYLARAKEHRIQGHYGAALAELTKAQGIDPKNGEIRQEIEQTQRACLAEKSLGGNPSGC